MQPLIFLELQQPLLCSYFWQDAWRTLWRHFLSLLVFHLLSFSPTNNRLTKLLLSTFRKRQVAWHVSDFLLHPLLFLLLFFFCQLKLYVALRRKDGLTLPAHFDIAKRLNVFTPTDQWRIKQKHLLQFLISSLSLSLSLFPICSDLGPAGQRKRTKRSSIVVKLTNNFSSFKWHYYDILISFIFKRMFRPSFSKVKQNWQKMSCL